MERSEVGSDSERPLGVPSGSAAQTALFVAVVAIVDEGDSAMSHANKGHDTLALNHDPTSKLPSKSSQPPIAMAKAGFLDHDSRTYLVKKYRTIFASAPAAAVSVLAGVNFTC